MTHISREFSDLHRAKLESIFELTDELGLMYRPDVFVRGGIQSDDVDAQINGLPVNDYRDTPDEHVSAIAYAKIGLVDLNTLATVAAMNVSLREIGAAIPDETIEYTPDQEKFVDEVSQKAEKLILDTEGRHATYNFPNTVTSEAICVRSNKLTAIGGTVVAREVSLSVSDEFTKREITVSELPVSFDGESELSVEQKILPVYGGILDGAKTLFDEEEIGEGLGVLHKFCSQRLRESSEAVEGLDELRAKFQGLGRLNELEAVLEDVSNKVDAAKAGNRLSVASPDLLLPSEADLDQYVALLSDMRA